jgi:molecular chaperone DnaK
MDEIYGIDLGTSNCLAAKAVQFLDDTEIETLSDDEGNESFPSIVHFKSDFKVIVGEKAKALLPEYPEQTIELVKTRIGKENEMVVNVEDKEKQYSPQEICSIMLRHFHKLHNNRIKKAILTVPAYFDDNQKKATRQAGELSDIEIVELIEEPSAAIMYYLYDKYKEYDDLTTIMADGNLNYLVFDFGGGTLDLSLIKVELDTEGNLKPSVPFKGGDMELGGNVIDFELTHYLLRILHDEYEDQFTRQLLIEFDHYYKNRRFRPQANNEVKQFILLLKNMAEDSKIRLSIREEVKVNYGHLNYDNIRLTRTQFEKHVLIPYFKKRILSAVRSLFEKSGGTFRVNEVVMVGGTSQIPYFKKLLEDEYPYLKGKIVYSHNYKNAIANGAAILGAIKSGLEVKPFGKNRCYNSVGHNILVSHRDNKELLIPHSIQYPFENPIEKSVKIKHSLKTDIELSLFAEIEKYNHLTDSIETCEIELKHVNFYHPFFYTNEEVTLTVNLDEFGLLSFTASHESTNESIDFQSEELHLLDPHKFLTAKLNLDRISE